MSEWPHVYRWNRKGRKGQLCRVTARSKRADGVGPDLAFGVAKVRSFNSVRLEFMDGHVIITSGNAIRKRKS